MKKILITGTAGFIGYHLLERIREEGYEIVGLDNINDYYEINLKYSRLANTGIDIKDVEYGKMIKSSKYDNYRFIKMNLEDKEGIEKVFAEEKFDMVVNLAAQAGVRHSLTNPHTYIDSNIYGFLNILEGSRHTEVEHLIYASSSSVYGANKSIPFSESNNIDHPISLYAASKKSNELMAHTYSALFNVPTTGLRFFTVYGPWGRPDMALFIFTKSIIEGKQINIFNHGNMLRDFTYVADIVESIKRLIPSAPKEGDTWDGMNPDPSFSFAKYKVYNIGNSSPVKLLDFVEAIEKELGIEANKNFMDIQPGDVPKTYANTEKLYTDIDFRPQFTIEEGIHNFISWYKEYYKVG